MDDEIQECWICNGYYGPSYEEPVCGTCHAFLFASTALEEQPVSTMVPESDEDSGNENDEPPYNNVNVPVAVEDVADPVDDNNMDEEEDEDELPENAIEEMAAEAPALANALPLARANPPRDLLQYLDLLSVPRENDKNDPRIEDLPTEVLLCIFSFLDDLSLASVGRVCLRWKSITLTYTTDDMWRQYTKKRWPLFQEIVRVPNWFEMYYTLMTSCFCRTCLIDMAEKTPMLQVEGQRKLRRLRNEIHETTDGIDIVGIDSQLVHLQASIVGPSGSPYEGGKFFLYIVVPQCYPMFPPTVRFLTKIAHPNVSRHGDVGIDIIQHKWSVALNIPKILLSVQSLLTDPFTEICMEPSLGKMYETDRPRFEALAKKYTWKYAMHELIPPL